jgi:hypothetical protein
MARPRFEHADHLRITAVKNALVEEARNDLNGVWTIASNALGRLIDKAEDNFKTPLYAEWLLHRIILGRNTKAEKQEIRRIAQIIPEEPTKEFPLLEEIARRMIEIISEIPDDTEELPQWDKSVDFWLVQPHRTDRFELEAA